ncbi:MAG: ferritin family protein [bacterium]
MDKHPIQQFIVHTLIKQAITFEQESVSFYQRAAEQVKKESSRTLLLSFAEEEQRHKQQLEQFLSNDLHQIIEGDMPVKPPDLAIDFELLHRKITSSESEKEIIELARMKEKASATFYQLLAQRTKIHSAKQVFIYLAQQEQSHLNKLETEIQ